MKITANKDALNNLIGKISRCIPKYKSIISIYENLRFDITGDTCIITGGDSDIQVSGQIIVESDEDFSFCALESILSGTIRQLNDETVTLEIKEYKGKGKTVVVSAGKGKKYKLPMEESENYGLRNLGSETIEVEMEAKDLIRCFVSSSENVNPKDLRTNISGISIMSIEDKLMFRASDSYVIYHNPIIECKDFKEILVPRNVGEMCSNLTEEGLSKIITDGDNVIIKVDGLKIMSSLIKSSFYNTEGFFKSMSDTFIEVDRLSLLGAIRRLTLYTNESVITLNVNKDFLNVLGSNELRQLEGSEEVDIISTNTSVEININVSAQYITRVLSRMEVDNVYMYMDENSEKMPIFILPTIKEDISESWILAPFYKS